MSMEFVLGREIIDASLERTIRVDGEMVTNLAFAQHLFLCARDMLPFEDALLIYGYLKTDFDAKTLTCFERCYNIGNSHLKRELSNKMINCPEERSGALDLLDRLFGLFLKSDEGGGNIDIHFNLQPSKAIMDDSYSVSLYNEKKEEDNVAAD